LVLRAGDQLDLAVRTPLREVPAIGRHFARPGRIEQKARLSPFGLQPPSTGVTGTTINSSMGNFSLSEIVTILLIILIVFGPNRLPEMARKTGELIRKARETAAGLRREFESEFHEITEPLKEVGEEIKGVKSDMKASARSWSEDLRKAKDDVEQGLAEIDKPLSAKMPDAADPDLPRHDAGDGNDAGTGSDPEGEA